MVLCYRQMLLSAVLSRSTQICNVMPLRTSVDGYTITSVCKTVTSACPTQCRYFAIASKECYAPRLQTTITCVDRQVYCNFHKTVQCYRQMLYNAVTLCSNILYLVSSSRILCYVTCLYPPYQVHKS